MADFYSMEEAARVLGISQDELKRKIQNGELRQVGGGSTTQFRKSEIDEYARRQGLGSDPDVQSDLSLDDLDFNDIFLGQGDSDLGAHTVGISKSEVEAALGTQSKEIEVNPLGAATGASPGASDVQVVKVAPQGASDSDVRISPVGSVKGPTDSDVTLLSAESVELDLTDLMSGSPAKPSKASDTATGSIESDSSGEIPLIDDDSGFDLSPSGVIEALRPESGSDFELATLDSSSEFEVPATQTVSVTDVPSPGSPVGSGVNLSKPNDSGIGLADFDADSIELAPIEDVKPAPKPAPVVESPAAKSGVKQPVGGGKPGDTGVPAVTSAFDDTDFELTGIADDASAAPVDQTLQLEENSDFELVEQSDEMSLVRDPLDVAGSGVKKVSPTKGGVNQFLDDSDGEISVSQESGSDELTEQSAKPKTTAKPAPTLIRSGAGAEWGTPWVVGLGVSTVMMLLLCMVAFDLVKNLYEFRGDTPVASGLIKQIAGLLGGK